MTRFELLAFLTKWFLEETSGAAESLGINQDGNECFDTSAIAESELFILLRSLMNVRPAKVLPGNVERVLNDFLQKEIRDMGIVDSSELPLIAEVPGSNGQISISLWQGDIATINVDAIVNAANSALLGCWQPCHSCIDNAIHTYAGVQLRMECQKLMDQLGHNEYTGQAKLTSAYNLPSKYILHTVGPIVYGNLTGDHKRLLGGCYNSCLKLAEVKRIRSIAFCCISTGEYRFPNERAAEIAVDTIKSYFLMHPGSGIRHIVFNVFKDVDYEIYKNIFE